jgi:hypothetical protein
MLSSIFAEGMAMRGVVSGLVIALAGFQSGIAAPASAPVAAGQSAVRIHLTVSGGYHYTGTWTHPDNASQLDGCWVDGNAQEKQYNVGYNGKGVLLIPGSKVKRDVFVITVQKYVPGARYVSSLERAVSLIVFVHKHPYGSDQEGPGTINVRVASNGLSGRITATQVTAWPGFKEKPVSVQAAWSCGILHHQYRPSAG